MKHVQEQSRHVEHVCSMVAAHPQSATAFVTLGERRVPGSPHTWESAGVRVRAGSPEGWSVRTRSAPEGKKTEGDGVLRNTLNQGPRGCPFYFPVLVTTGADRVTPRERPPCLRRWRWTACRRHPDPAARETARLARGWFRCSAENRIHRRVPVARYALCGFGESSRELNALMFAFKPALHNKKVRSEMHAGN